ncbi:MAG: hypothetical protein J6N76_10400 [Lachnospiraceae bacterium]|nr:hypothetical protein [Lachnospiraceae bacterium]
MAALEQNEREVLETLIEYSPKLIHGMQVVCTELLEDKAEDTYEYLKTVVEGMNWEIEVFNGFKELFAEMELSFDKDSMNEAVLRFNDAYKAKDDVAIAKCLMDDTIDVFILIEDLSKQALAK